MLEVTADCREKKGKHQGQRCSEWSHAANITHSLLHVSTWSSLPSLPALSRLLSHTNGSTSHCSHVPGTWVLALSYRSTLCTEGQNSGDWSRWWVGLDCSWQRQAGRMTMGRDH